VELKEAVPEANAKANLELARDLASLSVDGGVFIVGVSDKTYEVVGVPDSAKLVDRIIQVASGRIYPPLFVDTACLADPADNSRAVVIISVPASASAPHMADERYWGRSAQGKRVLSDREIEHLVSERRRYKSNLLSDVAELSDNLDELDVADRKHGHLYIICRPIGYTGPAMSSLIAPDIPAKIVLNALGDFRPQWGPFENVAHRAVGHPDGVLIRSYNPGTIDEKYQFAMLWRDDGAIHIVFGGGTRSVNWESGEETLSAGQLLTLVHSVALIAGYLGSEKLGFWGEWEFGLSLDKLKGLYSMQRHIEGWFESSPYPQDEYRNSERTTTRELSEMPSVVAARMVGPLFRGLGVDRIYLPYEDPDDIARRS
jgi:hypothetical protein